MSDKKEKSYQVQIHVKLITTFSYDVDYKKNDLENYL